MLIYKLKSISDITLNKYQAFSDSGIDGMLKIQTQFIWQMYRISLLSGVVSESP